MSETIILVIIFLLVIVNWFMLSYQFRKAAEEFDKKNYKNFGNEMAWLILFAALLIKIVV